MKRTVSIVLAVLLVASLALTACQGGQSKGSKGSDGKGQASIDLKNVKFKQSPMLNDKGLPSVKDRLPTEPKLTNEMPADMLKYEIGTFGGTLRTVTSAVDWDADVFVMNNEAFLNTPGILGKEITGNVMKSYEVSSDQKEYTFHMREGLKWSDGQPVTMEDIKFTVEDFLFNKELTPIFPAWLNSGGKVDGKPFTFEAVDDWTFKLKFDEAYGGLAIRLAIQGWRGYTELLKPAHYLKKFHKKYAKADELEAEIKKAGFEKGEWVNLFTDKDILNWELTNPKAIGFPVLYPWVFAKKQGNQATFERNPYYFKIDSKGNQLPYIDNIVSNLVQDIEMVTMKTISGEVDFCRESASLIKMSLYKENEKNGIKALLASMHVTPTDIFINQTFKDETWRKVTQDVRFRKALNMALDRKEIIDAIYYGFAEEGKIVESKFDMDGANKLLDEMGMKKGTDGVRTAPDGKKFSMLIEVGAQAPDIVPLTELLVEQWKELSLDVKMKRIEQSLWTNKVNANEIQATMIWTHTPLWYMGDWGINMWGKQWELWKANAGAKGEEPPADVKNFYKGIDELSVLPPDQALKKFDELKEDMKKNVWYYVHIDNVKQPLVINAKLRNVSDKGFAIAANFSAEQFFFKK
jgi:peptide/nickel transport system substrate-binding protein